MIYEFSFDVRVSSNGRNGAPRNDGTPDKFYMRYLNGGGSISANEAFVYDERITLKVDADNYPQALAKLLERLTP